MKSLSERVLLAGVLSGVLTLMTASCSSSSSSPPGGGGNSTSSGGSSSMSHGGSSNSTGGSGVGVGGNGTPQGGTGTGTGGSVSVAGSAGMGTAGSGGGATAMCSTDTNLVNSTGCFVGCDPTLSTDNPQGLQGAFYTFGDGSSCTPMNPPCSTMGICLSGTTSVDPTYAKWGCGMGMELNATGGTPSVKQAYTGPAGCFNYTLTGNSGGNEVRIAFTQTADTTGKISPYVSIPAFNGTKMGTICTKDVTCQGADPTKCALTGMVYDLQINVVGGNTAGAYNLCLTSLTPVTNGTSTLSQICGKQGATDGSEDVGKYFAQNNVNTPGDKLCITPALNGTTASFKVDSATFATGATLNAYPSFVDGWHYGRVSTDPALPKAISALQSANSSVMFTGSDSKYDAAYDIWVLPTLPSSAVKTPAGGLEIMIWLNHSNPPQPAGGQGGTFNGYNVWTGTVQNWNYVAYEATGKTSFSGDLKPFITDAISRKGTQMAAAAGGPWLAGIEFGFELYDYPGTGFAVTSFTSDVK